MFNDKNEGNIEDLLKTIELEKENQSLKNEKTRLGKELSKITPQNYSKNKRVHTKKLNYNKSPAFTQTFKKITTYVLTFFLLAVGSATGYFLLQSSVSDSISKVKSVYSSSSQNTSNTNINKSKNNNQSTQNDINLEFWQKKATEFYNSGDLNTSLHFYNKCLEIDPNNIYVLNKCGEINDSLERIDTADIYYDKISELIPDNSSFWYIRGKHFEDQNDLPRSNDYYRRAIKIKPDYTGAIEAKRRNSEKIRKNIINLENSIKNTNEINKRSRW